MRRSCEAASAETGVSVVAVSPCRCIIVHDAELCNSTARKPVICRLLYPRDSVQLPLLETTITIILGTVVIIYQKPRDNEKGQKSLNYEADIIKAYIGSVDGRRKKTWKGCEKNVTPIK